MGKIIGHSFVGGSNLNIALPEGERGRKFVSLLSIIIIECIGGKDSSSEIPWL
jgi:hypothetical protein